MAYSRKDFSKKGSNKRGCIAASKGRSHSKRHRLSDWKWGKGETLDSIEVDPNDDETLRYISSKVYNEIRSLHSKPGNSFAEFGAIFYSLYWIAEARHLILFKDSKGRNVGVLAYDVVTPWYTRRTCFEELFVLGLDPTFHGFGRVAMYYMRQKAKELGCSLMETGASMTDKPKMIENLYKRHGKCTFSYKNFVWVLPNAR